MEDDFKISIGRMGRECTISLNDKDISKYVQRIIVDAKPMELTKIWIQISPMGTKFEVTGIENPNFYIPEDIPKIPED